MRLVSTTFKPTLYIGFLLFFGSFPAFSQDNSPFSRYGLGNIVPGQHIANRGLGGISAAYRDPLGQSVNFYNPASYSAMALVSYDLALSVSTNTLKSANPINTYSATNFTPSYVVMGMPLYKKRGLGLAFGLRPVTKIAYSILENTRVPGIDSVSTLYEGNGGLYQGFFGVGKRWGGLSIGFNGEANFGRKETDTRVLFNNDSVVYQSANFATITTFNKFTFLGGLQYQFKTGKQSQVRIGLTGRLQQKLKASQDQVRETFFFDVNGTSIPIDTAKITTEQKGTIILPATYTAGIAFETFTPEKLSRLMVSAEYENTKWSDYRFFGQPDKLVDNWHARLGIQLSPNYLKATNFWSRVTYRAGAFTGKDYINADGNELRETGVTVGVGLPVVRRNNYSNQYSNIHMAAEFGKRGSGVNNITESFFRFSVGFSLSDIWFVPRKYD